MQKFVSLLFERLMKSWSWVLLVLLCISIKWLSLYPGLVERYYTYGIYPVIVAIQRFILGWIPFSIGDLFYGFLVLVLIYRISGFIRLAVKKQLNRQYFIKALQQGIFFFLFIYVSFNLLWGLNYNRQGIAVQLGLKVQRYSLADLDTLTQTLKSRLNTYAEQAGPERRDSVRKKKDLFRESAAIYDGVSTEHPFLAYGPRSLKPSIFSYLGNYLGFQGYYNPFSGEAQVNTTIPPFLEPFVSLHEIAHQLGYGKENEANFVAFLAGRQSRLPLFRYSMYFDLFNYSYGEMRRRDTAMAKSLRENLHPVVIADIREQRAFYQRHRNPVENFVSWGYGNFLKANNQPGGKETYNEVVAWLIAYYKKFGVEAL
ncbi:MAG: DUF3810 domain-containing protein [Chitinophagaceae bacterium]